MTNPEAVRWLEEDPDSPYNLDENTVLRTVRITDTMTHYVGQGMANMGLHYSQPMIIYKDDTQ